ncbi:MAG: amidohydrolase family protein [Acidimicrobiales bacterium]
MGFGAANLMVGRQLGALPAAPAEPVLDPDTVALPGAAPAPDPTHVFDTVITGGRLVDPATGFDAIGDIGIDAGVITAFGGTGYLGATVIDATARVVAPGFIDLLSAEPNGFGEWNKLADGVTTNLAMHGVNNYAEAFFRTWTGQTPLHFGGAWHQQFIRAVDPRSPRPPKTRSTMRSSSPFERLTENLRAGFAGVLLAQYAPGTSFEEMRRIAATAQRLGHMSYFHLRHSEPGTGPEGVREAIQIATDTGSAVHMEHLASTGGTEPEAMAEAITLIEAARASGLDITACIYPYDFWATTLGSFRFAQGWGDRYGITFSDLEVAGQGRRLSADTFEQAQAENLLVAAHGTIPEATIELALQTPWMMVGSDAILTRSLNNHPRSSGCFSRLLGQYVRERQVLDLTSALSKITIQPARRFESMLPDLTRKGRLQRGADADIVVFDPLTIRDQATVAQPELRSIGIDHVFVEGTHILRSGQLDETLRPGRPMLSVTIS